MSPADGVTADGLRVGGRAGGTRGESDGDGVGGTVSKRLISCGGQTSSRLCVELNHRKEVMVNVLGTLQPTGTVALGTGGTGGVEDVAAGVVTGVAVDIDADLTDEELALDELSAVELVAGAEVEITQPRS
ncbi:hypothetical protein DHEL01_v208024 [Diaporthe helianthi]|uniref:Uncharacterized protein n=1 Tax=Diaporthe helianthi TaxID=158607 RepID=A0A2P5HTJ5_DIAHE|nr:hypothetical protein DHEL01_v208024 [Diaporthe helianthi]